MTPRKVCRQSVVYLGAVYLIYLPLYAYAILSVMGDENSFVAGLAMSAINTSMGLWIALVYWYFSFYGSSGATKAVGGGSSKRTASTVTAADTEHHLTSEAEEDCNFVSAPFTSIGGGNNSAEQKRQRQEQEQKEEEASSSSVASDDCSKISCEKKKNNKASAAAASAAMKYSFNIFDGTNLAGSSDSPFADFLFEGDDDEGADNQAETDYWAGCQQL